MYPEVALQALESLFERLARKGVLVVLAGAWALVFTSVIVTLGQLMLHTGGVGILDFAFAYSPADVADTFDAYGPEGFVLYRRIQLLDVLNPALYGLFLAGVLWRAAGRASVRWCAVLPLLAAALDYAENTTLYALSTSYPDIAVSLVRVSSAIGVTKHLSIGFAMAGAMAVAWAWRRERLA